MDITINWWLVIFNITIANVKFLNFFQVPI
jgi:hypothetical protein